jgi:hypothetical protein
METQQVKTERTSMRDLFLRTVAVLGLIAILLLGAWGIIQLAFAVPSVLGDFGANFSSFFSHPTTTNTATSTKEAVVVTVPGTAVSGSTLDVSWMHQNAASGMQYSYAISYACANGLSVKAPLPTGSFQAVPCNTLFNYVNASQHMNLVPAVTGGAGVPMAVTVVATKLSTGTVTASGTASVTIAPATGTKTTTTPTSTKKPTSTYTTPYSSTYTSTTPSTKYYPAATRTKSLYGYGDLAVRFTSVAPSANTTVVNFVIENTGTNVIPAGWTFNADLPINGSYTFGSQPQQALYPGDKIAYTLSFAGANSATSYPATSYNYNYGNSYGYSYPNTGGYTTSGYTCNGYNCTNGNYVNNSYPNTNYGYGYQTATITITADPQGFVPEYNKGNNVAQTTIPLY